MHPECLTGKSRPVHPLLFEVAGDLLQADLEPVISLWPVLALPGDLPYLNPAHHPEGMDVSVHLRPDGTSARIRVLALRAQRPAPGTLQGVLLRLRRHRARRLRRELPHAVPEETRLIVGCAIGPRDKETAEELWYSLPPDYRQQAVCFTDFYQVYARVLPSKRHKAVGKETGKTAHIERFNSTLRQRCSRLVRKALSFSKKLANHIGAIWLFIHDYNAQICARLEPTTTC